MNKDLYCKTDLLTYNEIEEDRITNKRYVMYDFNKIDDRLPDKYDPSNVWCRCMISPTGDESRSRKAILFDKYKSADIYSENMDPKYEVLTSLLKDYGWEHMIPHINMCCTLNVTNSDICQQMLVGGGSINYDLLISDIKAAKSSPHGIALLYCIFRRLYAQVYAAALNGIYTYWFCTALNHDPLAHKEDFVSRDIDSLPSHKNILEHYQKNVLCDRTNPKAILIPNEPLVANPFANSHKFITESDKKDSLNLALFFVHTKEKIEDEAKNFRRVMIVEANKHWYGKVDDATPFPQDRDRAVYYYRLAASSGDPALRLECGLKLIDFGKNKEAISYLSSVSKRPGDDGRAARKALVKAYYGLKDYEKMHELIPKSVEDGSTEAYYYLGEAYYNGLGVNENKKRALTYYRTGAEKGDAECKMMFVCMCVMEFGHNEDAKLATKIITENKDLNDRQNYELGLLYFRLKDYYSAYSAFAKIPYRSSILSEEELDKKEKLKKICFKKSGF